MSLYSPDPDGRAGEEKGSGAAGRLMPLGLRAAPVTGRELAGLAPTGLAATLIFFATVPVLAAPRGLMVDVAVLAAPTLAVPVLAVPVLAVLVLGFAGLDLMAVVAGLAVPGLAEVRDLAAVPGLAVAADLAAGRDVAVLRRLAMADFRAAEVLAPAGLAAIFRAVVFFVVAGFGAAAGLAVDIVFAAAVSALAAVVMALVAAFIACSAVDMVLADEVALVAAEVILVAAEVTFAAADETVRAAAAEVGAFLAAAGLAAPGLAAPGLAAPGLAAPGLAAPGLAAERALDWLVTRRVVPLVRVRAPAVFTEPRRTGLRAVDCRGIDLPP
jgi:hypothetical protein